MRRSRDSGIFWPGQDRVKQDPNKTFALSVHNSRKSFYTDVPPLYLDDGTWVIKYSVQAPGTVGSRDQNYNRKMLNCMECGVPVGVIFATEVGYKVLGLAFVERFEPENGWFGPNTVFLEAHRIEFDHSEKKREKAGLLPY